MAFAVGCTIQSPEEQALTRIQEGIANEPMPKVAILSSDRKRIRITVFASDDVMDYVVRDLKIAGQRPLTRLPIALGAIEKGCSSNFVVDFQSPIIANADTQLEIVRSTKWKSGLEAPLSRIWIPVTQW